MLFRSNAYSRLCKDFICEELNLSPSNKLKGIKESNLRRKILNKCEISFKNRKQISIEETKKDSTSEGIKDNQRNLNIGSISIFDYSNEIYWRFILR